MTSKQLSSLLRKTPPRNHVRAEQLSAEGGDAHTAAIHALRRYLEPHPFRAVP